MPVLKSPIRQLAWDYYLGKITPREEYLRRRRLLISTAISGEPAPVFDSADSLSGELDLEVDADSDTLIPSSENSKKPAVTPTTIATPGKKSRLPVIAATAVTILVVAGGIVTFLSVDEPTPALEEQTTTDSVVRTAPPLPESIQEALRSFENSGWSDQAAVSFVDQWTALPEKTRQTVKNLPTLSALKEIVAQQSAELMTLASAGIEIPPQDRTTIDELSSILDLPANNWAAPLAFEETTALAEFSAATDPADLSPGADSFDEPPDSVAVVAESDNQPEYLATVTDPLPSNKKRITTTNALPEVAAKIQDTQTNITGSSADQVPEMTAAPATTALAETPPKVTQQKVSSRPASVVLSERGGCAAILAANRVLTCRDFLSSKIRAPRMAIIPAGSFTMGDARHPVESPQIKVSIPSAIAISTHEISFREFQLFCKNSNATCPSNPGGDNHMPVVGVSWQDATDYTRWLTQRTGNTYRLPSEAEWEYAARAGTTSVYPFGDNLMVTQARYSTRSREAAEPLANTYLAINPNDFQLYHMVGNVREWVADSWQDHHDSAIATGSPRPGAGQRVVRGGSFADNAEQLRSSARQPLDGDVRDRFTGFRILLDFAANAS